MSGRLLFLVIALLISPLSGCEAPRDSSPQTSIATAYTQKLSELLVEGEGRVIKILPDDNQGSRHQRFIIALASGQTLLIAHNIDLAPRISNLTEGDTVAFFGEYIWNAKGGIIHWTHRDPQGRHPAGWIRHAAKKYQ